MKPDLDRQLADLEEQWRRGTRRGWIALAIVCVLSLVGRLILGQFVEPDSPAMKWGIALLVSLVVIAGIRVVIGPKLQHKKLDHP